MPGSLSCLQIQARLCGQELQLLSLEINILVPAPLSLICLLVSLSPGPHMSVEPI